MSSKESILQRIRQNKPDASPLPEFGLFDGKPRDLIAEFKENLQFVGGLAIELMPGEEINTHIEANYPDLEKICSLVEGVSRANINASSITDPHLLNDIELAIVPGEFGVAENGAVWISEKSVLHRVLPFIVQHLVIVLDKSKLVWNMHQAYQQDELHNVGGFGLFLSGPSKTADIEQSLVIGAHGSRSLIVLLV
ncbi:lactate utilization protein C [Parabacteroides sp. FAFU027]|uniref:LutC/YkgG family protein n=1 Tax=Parabacteroides sp. FAFU027 TaxID=2922715 RepID=UPI001FAFF8C9|nr:LUD domain-containing protein [Parabacteroides sp. FAFU027]